MLGKKNCRTGIWKEPTFIISFFSANIVFKIYSNIEIFPKKFEILLLGEEEMGGHDRDSKEERERSKKQGVKKVESDWKWPLGRWGRLASKCVLALNYSHVTELLNKDRNYFLKDDDLPDPCVETLNPAEKEIAHILGPETFTGIPGGHDSMGTFGEDYICILIFSEKLCV